LAEQMAFDATSPNQCLLPHALLSDREFEVFRRLIAGFGVNEIAEQLSISNKTVSTHKVHMMEKMNLGSVAELVRYAMQHGLTD
jgi:DNA-binding NarL/FixJ family response regulator